MNTEIQKPKNHSAVNWMTKSPITANLIMIFCILGGLFMAFNIRQEIFPDTTIDTVIIQVPYPSASPEEIEQGIILSIEENIRGITGIKKVTSTAMEGSAYISAELLEGEDLQKISQDVKNAVDRITTFPQNAEDPQVSTISLKHQVVSFAIYGDVDDRTIYEVSEQARDILLSDSDITQVKITGVRKPEISIEVSQDNLRRYNITLKEVADRISLASTDLPAGGIKTKGGEIFIRMDEKKEYGKQFAEIPVITTEDGNQILLEDIATIKDDFEDIDYYSTYNGKPSAMIEVYRVGNQTPIEVADAVYKKFEEFKTVFPESIQTGVIVDKSEMYRDRVNLLLRNGSIGLVLVLFVLGLFLELRLAFWVMMGIPISFLGSIFFLPLTGISINMISLFAYIMTLGIVVDDAIVVGENIYHNKQRGMSLTDAAVNGTKEVMMPVTFSILTNIAAFLPLFFIPGTMGKIFLVIPSVIVTVFIISLLESLFVLPSHLAHAKECCETNWLHKKQQAFSLKFTHFVREKYAPFLDKALKVKYVVIAIGFSILLLFAAAFKGGKIGMTFMPKVESEYAVVLATLPHGSPIEKTNELRRNLIESAERTASKIEGGDRLLKGTSAIVGSLIDDEGRVQQTGSHLLTVFAYMADADIRQEIMGTDEFMRLWREDFGEIAEVEYIKFKSDFGSPAGGAALTVEINHRDIETLRKAGMELSEEIRKFQYTSDVNDGFEEGKPQLSFIVNSKGKALGLTAVDVAVQVRNAIYGAEVSRQQRERSEMKVMVRFPKNERASEYTIEDMILRTPAGGEVMLKDVVEIERGNAYTTIERTNGRRQIQITADVTPLEEATYIVADLKKRVLPKLQKKYKGLGYSFEGQQAEMRDSIVSLGKGMLVSLLGIFVLLSLPFQSYVQPIIVMICIPFGIIGAVIGHMIMGFSISIISMLGFVALSGVVVNDSLVLIEYANRIRNTRNWSPHDAVLEAGIQRFRPIILTTLTTFFGLMPMIFETDFSTRFLIPMAISLGFGILFVTVIVLLFLPCFYLAVEDVRGFCKENRRVIAKWWRIKTAKNE